MVLDVRSSSSRGREALVLTTFTFDPGEAASEVVVVDVVGYAFQEYVTRPFQHLPR